jgi:hypothetical protein
MSPRSAECQSLQEKRRSNDELAPRHRAQVIQEPCQCGKPLMDNLFFAYAITDERKNGMRPGKSYAIMAITNQEATHFLHEAR